MRWSSSDLFSILGYVFPKSVSVLSVVLAILSLILDPGKQISVRWFGILMAISIFLSACVFNLFRYALSLGVVRVCKVIDAPSFSRSKCNFVLLLEVPFRRVESLFSFGSFVSLFYLDDSGYERHIAYGQVLNVQQNSLVQVAVFEEEGGENVFRRAKSGEISLDRLIVKPFVVGKLNL